MNKQININISGDEFSREQVEALIENLNEAIDDVDIKTIDFSPVKKSLYIKFLEMILRWLE